jgi:hypothetical protein
MSFWEDASGVVKGAIIFGVVGLLYLGVAAAADLAPFGSPAGDEIQQVRGLGAGAGQ